MIHWPLLAALLQVFPAPPEPPIPPKPPESLVCANKDTIVNAVTINTCVPGLTASGFGTARSPERQRDGTWLARVPYRAQTPAAIETTICGIDLIDFRYTGSLDVSEARDPAHYCVSRGYRIPAGVVTLELRTRTQFANLVIRSSVMATPVATILEQPPSAATAVIVPPIIVLVPPPPPPVVPPAVPPAPPPF